MELTLTTRYITTNIKTKTVEAGQKVEYYKADLSGVKKPSYGIIKEDEDGFYVEWEDAPDTRLDGSESTNEILEHVGFIG